jgi:hypothetical protein
MVPTFRFSGFLGPFSTVINKFGGIMHPNLFLKDGLSLEVFLPQTNSLVDHGAEYLHFVCRILYPNDFSQC